MELPQDSSRILEEFLHPKLSGPTAIECVNFNCRIERSCDCLRDVIIVRRGHDKIIPGSESVPGSDRYPMISTPKYQWQCQWQ